MNARRKSDEKRRKRPGRFRRALYRAIYDAASRAAADARAGRLVRREGHTRDPWSGERIDPDAHVFDRKPGTDPWGDPWAGDAEGGDRR